MIGRIPSLNHQHSTIIPALSSRRSKKRRLELPAGHKLNDEDDDRDDQDEVNETAGDIQSKPERPEDEKNNED